MRRIARLSLLLVLASLLVLVGCGPAEEEAAEQEAAEEEGSEMEEIGGSVSLIATWGGNERDVLMEMLAPFEERTGITVNYTGSRDMDAVVTSRVQAGNPPDIAAFSNPGKMAQFGRQGELVDLSGILDMDSMERAYSPGWIARGRVDGSLYGVFTKAAMKGLIWYDPATREEVGFDIPVSWQELLTISQDIAENTDMPPWSVGLESGGASGWPGTDWIESIFLKMHGPELYNQWHRGEVSWTSEEVRQAWVQWGEVVTNSDMIYGGKDYVLSTNFGEAHGPLYQEDPSAVFHHQATFLSGFITDQFPDLEAQDDFRFFAFPQIDPRYANSVIAAGDVFAVFNDTPQSRALIRYLATAEAQEYWLDTGAISPNGNVSMDAYRDPLTREAAELLRNAEVVVFDASDMMTSEVNQQFFNAVMDYVSNPDNLDQYLEELDRVRQESN